MSHEVHVEPIPEDEGRGHPQIWVGSSMDLEANIPHGQWLDATKDPLDIAFSIAGMLDASPTARRLGEPSEHWRIVHAAGFGHLALQANEDLAFVSRTARGIVTHGAAYSTWLGTLGRDAERYPFEKTYLGHFNDLGALALVHAVVTGDEAQPAHSAVTVDSPLGGVFVYVDHAARARAHD